MSKNQINCVAVSAQGHCVIAIKRSDLSNELWQDLFAASDRSANHECGNEFATS
jgi:hypothetical protein